MTNRVNIIVNNNNNNYIFHRNTPLQTDGVPKDAENVLQGIIVSINAHKTALKSTCEVWLSQVDQVLIEAYQLVITKYAKQKGLLHKYPITSTIFVNKKLNQFRDKSKTLNLGLFCEIVGIPGLDAHDLRRMFATLAGSSTSLLLRESAAFAACHSVETQQGRLSFEI